MRMFRWMIGVLAALGRNRWPWWEAAAAAGPDARELLEKVERLRQVLHNVGHELARWAEETTEEADRIPPGRMRALSEEIDAHLHPRPCEADFLRRRQYLGVDVCDPSAAVIARMDDRSGAMVVMDGVDVRSLAAKVIASWPPWKRELADRVLRPSAPPGGGPSRIPTCQSCGCQRIDDAEAEPRPRCGLCRTDWNGHRAEKRDGQGYEDGVPQKEGRCVSCGGTVYSHRGEMPLNCSGCASDF